MSTAITRQSKAALRVATLLLCAHITIVNTATPRGISYVKV